MPNASCLASARSRAVELARLAVQRAVGVRALGQDAHEHAVSGDAGGADGGCGHTDGELIHIDVKKLGRIQGGAGKRMRAGGRHYTPTYTDATGARRKTVGWQSATSQSTTLRAWPTSNCSMTNRR